MLEAQSRGLIDYSTFNIRDPFDVLKEMAVLGYVMDSISGDMLTLQHDRELLLLSMSPHMENPDQTKNKLVTSVFDVFRKYGRTRAPWLEWPEEDQHTIDNREMLDLKARWETHFGSLDDPEVQDKLAAYKRKRIDASKLPPSAKLIRRY